MKTDATLDVRIKMARRGHFVLDIAFEVPPGITILFGPSGAGKSTALAAIAGLVRPDAGRVTIGDEVWFDSERGIERPIHDRRVAYVFQSLALFPHMNAVHNVSYGIDRAMPRDARRRRALEMLARMKVSHLANRRPRTFSGGEAQRVALARAFARSPALVLLDEAFSAMDRELRQELCADVRRMVDELRIPALHVTHRRNEARAMGERVVLVRDGRVTATGSVAELLAEPATPDREDPVDEAGAEASPPPNPIVAGA